MLAGLKCFFGRHDWVRIGSAPAVFVAPQDPKDIRGNGYVLLLECQRCGHEAGVSDDGGRAKRWHTAAYTRSFIEAASKGHIRKGEA